MKNWGLSARSTRVGILKFTRLLLQLLFMGGLCGADSPLSSNNTHICPLRHCPFETGVCAVDTSCRKALLCNARCSGRVDEVGCNLLCQFNYGYENENYIDLLRCMEKHNCLPVLPMNGKCLFTNKTYTNLTDYEQIRGRWWIVRGLNCGQKDWTAGFDAFPCQYDEFEPEVEENGTTSTWIDRIGYCGGKDSICSTPYIHTKARVEIISPGVLAHYYLDAPLLPQNEQWYVLSKPHPDWMLYVYCGSTPTGPYGGGSVATRVGLKPDDIPPWVEQQFIAVAAEHGFDYKTMCLSDNTGCPDAAHSLTEQY